MVETQIVSAGDYVKVGDPLFQLVSSREAARPPALPRIAAPRLKKGQPWPHLAARRAGNQRARVSEIKPGVIEASRALDVIVDIDNEAACVPAARSMPPSVAGARRRRAGARAERGAAPGRQGGLRHRRRQGHQRVVEVGAKRGGMVEIVKGLPAGATVALDGAGFLTTTPAVASRSAASRAPRRASRRKVSPRNTAPPRKPPPPKRRNDPARAFHQAPRAGVDAERRAGAVRRHRYQRIGMDRCPTSNFRSSRSPRR
jgi:hypothetical protein